MMRSLWRNRESGLAVFRRPGLGTIALSSLLVCWASQAIAQSGQPVRILGAPGFQTSQIIPVQQLDDVDPDEPLQKPDPHVRKMPKAEYKLEVIENRSQFIVTNSRIVRTDIANPSIAMIVQYSPTEVAILGLERGATNVAFWFEGDPDPSIYTVSTIKDPSLEEQKRLDYGILERKLADLFPNSNVNLIPLSYKIIVKGQARDTEEAAQILQIVRGEVINQLGSLGGPQPGGVISGGGGLGGANDFGNGNANDRFSDYIVNMLEVPGEHQVMLRVRIAELNRSQLRRMGVEWDVLFNNGRNFLAGGLGGVPSTLTGIFENGDINVFINWLAGNGTATILAEPVLTVMSGHTASFLSGGEFAVPTIVGVSGAEGTSTTFRGFGTSLLVTPTLIDRDLVRLRIIPEFSAINSNNAVGGIPGLDSRRVQTTVQLREGQTIVLGGLFSRQTATEVTRIPLLGELPYIGHKLFHAKRATEDQSELLILVTPEIVRPMDADEVPPVPQYYVTHPDDYDLYHYGRTEGNPDTEVYQLPPYGRGAGHAIPVGYRLFNPAPASPMYAPVPNNTFGGGYSQGVVQDGNWNPAMGSQGRELPPMHAPAPGMNQPPIYATQPQNGGIVPAGGTSQQPNQYRPPQGYRSVIQQTGGTMPTRSLPTPGNGLGQPQEPEPKRFLGIFR